MWHRELRNRYERLLQEIDPDVALHYWDWATDPLADGEETEPKYINGITSLINGRVHAVARATPDQLSPPSSPPSPTVPAAA